MIKKLLFSCAVAAVALSASAEELWKSSAAEGVLVDWGKAAFSLSADEAASKIKAGDIVSITVSGVTEGGWPQVCVFSDTQGGYGAMLQNAGVGGNDYPYVVSFTITGKDAAKIAENGISFGGNGAYVSAVGYEKGNMPFDINPYSVWLGPKQCNWGNGVSLSKGLFTNVEPYCRIQVEYNKEAAEHTLQFLFGGWSGLNIPTYEAWKTDFVTIDEEAGVITIDLIPSVANLTWEVEGAAEEFDIFALLKENGLIMQGPCLVNQVIYMTLDEVNQEACNKVLAAIADVEAKYEAAITEIEAKYEGIDLSEWKEMIGTPLAEQKNYAQMSLSIATEERERYNFPFGAEEFEGMIEEMKNQAPNLYAYQKVVAEIEAVEVEYEAALSEIQATYPEFDLTEWKEIIGGPLNQAKHGADQAYWAAMEDGEPYFFPFGAEEFEGMIEEMKKDAANFGACQDVLAEIAAVEAKYEAALSEIEKDYPKFDLTEWKEMIGGPLNQAKQGAEQAYKATKEDGEAFFFPFDAEYYEGMIEEMKKAAAEGTTGIESIEAEVAAGNAKIFTLDGKSHNAPVKGQVNVIVKENSTRKVMVK